MALKQAQRVFEYDQMQLDDPDPTWTVEQVRDHYANLYPELTNAETDGPKNEGGKIVYEFEKAVGTKGAGISVRDLAAGKIADKKDDIPGRAEFEVMEKFGDAIRSRRSDGDKMILPPSDILALV